MPSFRRLGHILLLLAGLTVLGHPPGNLPAAAAAPQAIPVRLPQAAPYLAPHPEALPNNVAGVDPPPGCSFSNYLAWNDAPQVISDTATITSTIKLANIPMPVWEVSAQTLISHTFPSDLEVFLISPHGEHNALTTRNGATADNVFANTNWSDRNFIGVAEATFALNVNQPYLIPEGAMGQYRYQDPNGDWNLVIADVFSIDNGKLNYWSLVVTTLNERLRTNNYFQYNGTNKTINDNATASSTITVTGVGPYLVNLTVQTFVTHAGSGDLIMTLTAPNGLTTTLTAQTGDDLNNIFNGTLWTDTPAGGLGAVTDAVLTNNVPLTQTQPVGAMAHFLSIDPNGPWTLSIKDVNTGNTGLLNEWGLSLNTGFCTPVYLPEVTR